MEETNLSLNYLVSQHLTKKISRSKPSYRKEYVELIMQQHILLKEIETHSHVTPVHNSPITYFRTIVGLMFAPSIPSISSAFPRTQQTSHSGPTPIIDSSFPQSYAESDKIETKHGGNNKNIGYLLDEIYETLRRKATRWKTSSAIPYNDNNFPENAKKMIGWIIQKSTRWRTDTKM